MNKQVGKYYAILDTLNNGNSFVKVATEKHLLFFKEYEDAKIAEIEYNEILKDLEEQ